MSAVNRSSLNWLVALGVVGLLGCSGAPDAGPRIDRRADEVDDVDLRALLLLVEDRRVYDDYTVVNALGAGSRIRRTLAYGLGRQDDPRAGLTLEELLLDEEVEVRRAAAFALGRRGDPEAAAALLAACRSPDVETGRLAVESLAILGVDLSEVLAALENLPTEELWPRLAPSLFRFPSRRIALLAGHGVELENRRLAAQAAFALARQPLPQALPTLRGLLADADPRIRAWAARGLAQVGDGSDMASLLPLLDDPEPGPRIQALVAGGALVAAGRTAPPDAWRRPILGLLRDPRPGVARTAVEAAAFWLLDDELAEALAALWDSGSEDLREAALLALAVGGDPRAPELTRVAAVSPTAADRAMAARSAAVLGQSERLLGFLSDPVPRVRLAALAGLLATPAEGSESIAEVALEDSDAAVRAAALDWLTNEPVLPVEAIEAAMDAPDPTRIIDLSVNVVRALAARAEAEPLERGRILARLEAAAGLGDYPVRRLAAARIEALGEPRPAVGPAVRGRSLDRYRDIVRRTAEPRFVEIGTRHGTVRVRLACPEAPLTCLSFLQLTNQGFYDGLTFHRTTPDVMVQGGDPRGDGWGGPGYTIRDESGPLRFDDGVLGMALSAPDTAGSQFFITLSPQPQLNGVFTAFGSVVRGREVLDRVAQGDEILYIREVG